MILPPLEPPPTRWQLIRDFAVAFARTMTWFLVGLVLATLIIEVV